MIGIIVSCIFDGEVKKTDLIFSSRGENTVITYNQTPFQSKKKKYEPLFSS